MDDQQAVTIIRNELTWFQKHERIIVVALVLMAGVWLGNKYLNNAAADAQTRAAIAQKALDEAKSQAAQDARDYRMTIEAKDREIDALVVAVAQRTAITERKVKEVTQPKAVEQVIADIGTVYQPLDVQATATPEGKIAFPPPVVQQFAATKIEHDAEGATIVDQKKIISNLQIEVGGGKTLIGSLNKQIVASDAMCKAELDVVKKQARKSKRNWFIAGFLSGIATRILVKF